MKRERNLSVCVVYGEHRQYLSQCSLVNRLTKAFSSRGTLQAGPAVSRLCSHLLTMITHFQDGTHIQKSHSGSKKEVSASQEDRTGTTLLRQHSPA